MITEFTLALPSEEVAKALAAWTDGLPAGGSSPWRVEMAGFDEEAEAVLFYFGRRPA